MNLSNTPENRQPVLSQAEFEQAVRKVSGQAHSDLERERRENRQKALLAFTRRAAIPVRFAAARLAPKDGEHEAVYAAAKGFVAHFDERLKDGAGLIMTGDVGRGKTYLACAIANELAMAMHPVLYCTTLEAVQLIKASWVQKQSEFDVYARFAEPDLLVLDEIGVQLGSDFEQMVLTSIIDIRSRNCLPIVAITNLRLDDLLNLLGQRAFDRLLGNGGLVLQMDGPSMRMQKVNIIR